MLLLKNMRMHKCSETGSVSYTHLEGVLIDIDESNNYTPDKIVIITTGSQGEPMSALTRMAMSDHKKVDIVPGDTVIISATPIPGNEKLVSRTIDHLYKLGADVIYEKSNGVHVSGHASHCLLYTSLVKHNWHVLQNRSDYPC